MRRSAIRLAWLAPLLWLGLTPRPAAADTINSIYFRVEASYHTGEPDWVGEAQRDDVARVSREERLEHADVIATGGFVADANGLVLKSALEVAAITYIEPSGVYWDELTVYGAAVATTRDVLTIEGPAGAQGVIQFYYAVEGSLYHELSRGTVTGGGYVIDAMEGAGELKVTTNGVVSRVFRGAFEPVFSGDPNPAFPHADRETQGGPDFTPYFLFPFNTPFVVSFDLATEVYLRAHNLDAGELLWLGGAGFQNTANIHGIAVFDELLNPIANPTISSQSGLVYNLVPEPSGLLGLAGAALGLRASRPRAPRPALHAS